MLGKSYHIAALARFREAMAGKMVDSTPSTDKCNCVFASFSNCTSCGAKAPECAKCNKKSQLRSWIYCPDCGEKYIYN